jgi:hypothetical protein
MQNSEAYLYHQIHPLKLAADWIAAFVSLYFFWHHEYLFALLILFVLPLVASLVVARYANLERLKESAFGKYYFKYMRTRTADLMRFLGMLIMVIGALYHSPIAIIGGLALILSVWLRGKIWE